MTTSGRVRRFQDEARERLSSVRDFTHLGAELLDLSRTGVGVSGLNFFPLSASGIDLQPTVYCERYSGADAARRAAEFLPRAEADTHGFELAGRSPGKLIQLNELVGRRQLSLTTTYNELWRPLAVEEQLFGLVRGAEGTSCAFLCLSRSSRQRRFSDEERATAQFLCAEAERAVQRLQCEGVLPVYPEDPGGAMTALRHLLPLACGFLDEQGRVLWLSDEALAYLDVRTIRYSKHSYVSQTSPKLAAWRELARACAQGRAAEASVEQLAGATARKVDLHGRPAALIWARTGAAPTTSSPPALCDAGLTSRESQIASLLARGYTVLNIAHLLGLSEKTIRVHVRHVYRKLDVSNRVEFVLRFTAGSSPRR